MDDFTQRYKQSLLSIPTAKEVSGGKEIVMRCRYCPDSKDPRGAHMYVSIPNGESPSLFNCFKCGASGIVTPEVLLQWQCVDNLLFHDLSIYNKKILTLPQNRKFIKRDVYRLKNHIIYNTPIIGIKRKYICDRVGVQLSINELSNLKIVLSLIDLLKINNINNLTRNPDIVKELSESFVGFLSEDNSYVNMRKVLGVKNKSIDKRYINYNIFGNENNPSKNYTIPSSVDILNPRPVQLHIAEGPFDILSIFLNLRNRDLEQSVYTTVLGNSYASSLLNFILKTALINLVVHVYLDNDVPKYKIDDLIQVVRYYNHELYIHRNIHPGEKDFGVPIDRISESIIKI